MNSHGSGPLVSIGVPVYNGEAYLADALRTLLAQDYGNFELVISDNASTDRTEEICRRFQKADSRIRYIRQDENQGMCWNFAFVAKEACGEYIMWAAHDDLYEPSYVRKCLVELQLHPAAVICCTEADVIDGQGNVRPEWQNYKNLETTGMTIPQRIHQLWINTSNLAICGLLRMDAVRKLKWLGVDQIGPDRIILLEFLLMGDVVKVHEILFHYRVVKWKTTAEYQALFNPTEIGPKLSQSPIFDLWMNITRTIYESDLTSEDKICVLADHIFIQSSNPVNRKMVAAELLGCDANPTDAEFARLMTMVLSRAIPLDALKDNPLVQALWSGRSDILEMAEKLTAGLKILSLHDLLYSQGANSFNQQDFQEASRLFREALKQSESSNGWQNWATARLACQNQEEAEQGFRRSLELDGDNRQSALKLGILTACAGRQKDAIHYLEHGMPAVEEEDRDEITQLLAKCRAEGS